MTDDRKMLIARENVRRLLDRSEGEDPKTIMETDPFIAGAMVGMLVAEVNRIRMEPK